MLHVFWIQRSPSTGLKYLILFKCISWLEGIQIFFVYFSMLWELIRSISQHGEIRKTAILPVYTERQFQCHRNFTYVHKSLISLLRTIIYA